MDITVNDSTLTYLATGISIKKITISSISIDPLKRIANFTVSYWNGTVLLGQETKTYNATYTMLMTTQPTLKSISMPVITTYNTTITLNSTQYTIDTTVFPYFTSGLTIYYNPTDPSMISLIPTQNYIQFDNAMYTSAEIHYPGRIDIFYTIENIQYKIIALVSSSKSTAGITTIYYNSGRTKISLTMDSTFYDKYQLSQTDTISVRSVQQNLLQQTQTYSYVNIPTPIYKQSSTLPSLTIYYNPDKISDISLTNLSGYIQTTATFFSVVQDTNKYIFSNINYTVGSRNVTLSNKTLTGLDSTNLPPLYCNPLNQYDISLTQSTPDDYNKLLTFLNDPLNIVSISPLIKILNTSFSTKNVTNNINNTIIIQ
jgi:hypothetical protein